MRSLTSFIIILILTGCIKKQEIKPLEEVKEGRRKIEEIILKEKEEVKEYYTVIKGDCLWKIAGKEEIYNDPFMWPIIYDANRAQIKDPNLIYPNQKFLIPRSGISLEKIKSARRRAGAPPPYTPPINANIPK